MINLWLLYRHVDSKMSLLEFTRQVIIASLASLNVEKRRGVAPKTKKQILDATRLDGKEHLVEKNQDPASMCFLRFMYQVYLFEM